MKIDSIWADASVGLVKSDPTRFQMVLSLQFETAKGPQKVKCLVDTGAQVCLANNKTFHPSLFAPAKDPVRLVSADGSSMRGGRHVVKGRVGMRAVPRVRGSPPQEVSGQSVSFYLEPYMADIAYDLILSYPWLLSNGLWVSPPYCCLFRETHFEDQFILEPLVGTASGLKPALEPGVPELRPSSPSVNRMVRSSDPSATSRIEQAMIGSPRCPPNRRCYSSGGGQSGKGQVSSVGRKHSADQVFDSRAGSSTNYWATLVPKKKPKTSSPKVKKVQFALESNLGFSEEILWFPPLSLPTSPRSSVSTIFSQLEGPANTGLPKAQSTTEPSVQEQPKFSPAWKKPKSHNVKKVAILAKNVNFEESESPSDFVSLPSVAHTNDRTVPQSSEPQSFFESNAEFPQKSDFEDPQFQDSDSASSLLPAGLCVCGSRHDPFNFTPIPLRCTLAGTQREEVTSGKQVSQVNPLHPYRTCSSEAFGTSGLEEDLSKTPISEVAPLSHKGPLAFAVGASDASDSSSGRWGRIREASQVAKVPSKKVSGKRIPVAQQDFEHSEHPNWVSSTYYVPDQHVATIFEELGLGWDEEVRETTRDAFASDSNKRFRKYFDKHCSGPDGQGSFGKDWSKDSLLWVNAPFEKMDQVVQKIYHDRARAVVIAPVWEDTSWLQALDMIQESCFEIPRHWNLFVDQFGNSLPQRWWSCRAYLVDGYWQDEDGISDEESDDEELTTTKHVRRPIGHVSAFNDNFVNTSSSDQVVADLHRTLKDTPGIPSRRVRSVTTAVGELQQSPKVLAAIDRIKKEFGPTSLSGKTMANPPVRGPNGACLFDLLPGAKPRKARPCRMVGEREDAITRLLEELCERGWLENAISDWGSPCFPVPKRGSYAEYGIKTEWRLVVDYRWLNECTIPDCHPIPVIEDILERQGKNNIFTIIDMKHGFHQIPVPENMRKYTAMVTPNGKHLQWRVMPMGIKNAPSIFQRIMNWVLRDLPFATCYIDDILIGSTGATEEERIANHEAHVRAVLQRLEEHQMVAKMSKAAFFVDSVEFCGHILGGGCRKPVPGRLMAIQKWERPKTIRELRAFMGLCNWYSIYIKNLAKIGAPLFDMLKVPKGKSKCSKIRNLTWSEEADLAFDDTKAAFVDGLSLFILNPDKPFFLRTDASNYAIGAVLEQVDTDGSITGKAGQHYPIAFWSRKLAHAQLNWSPREKECYAILGALIKWAGWIGLQPVDVLTDHQSLQTWHTAEIDTQSGPVGRKGRWHELFSKFNLHVTYIAGKDNPVADALSRWAYPACQAFQDVSKHGSATAAKEVADLVEQEEREERSWVGNVRVRYSCNHQGHPYKEWLAQGETVHVCRVAPDYDDWWTSLGPPTKNGIPLPPPVPSAPVQLDELSEPRLSTPRRGAPKWVHPGGSTEAKSQPPATSGSTSAPTHEANTLMALHFGEELPEVRSVGVTAASGDPKDIFFRDWDEDYLSCPQWKKAFQACKRASGGDGDFPEQFRLVEGKLFHRHMLCVPEPLETYYLMGMHELVLPHSGADKLKVEVERRAAPVKGLLQKCKTVVSHCTLCQFTKPRHGKPPGELEPHPVPSSVMSYISTDVFHFQPTKDLDGIERDSVLLFQCRLTGYMVGIPVSKSLTGEQAAQLFLQRWLSVFDYPAEISSDRGKEFISSCFQTLCAGLGVRQAYGQAYRSQSHGKPENAGRQMIWKLRSLLADSGCSLNWIEALPRALSVYHHTPGPTGFSPNQLLFGRNSGGRGLPFPTSRVHCAMSTFIEKMEQFDRTAQAFLEKEHAKMAKAYNKARKSGVCPHQVGDRVLVKRPTEHLKGSGKLQTLWEGPVLVTRLTGPHTAEVQVSPNRRKQYHLDQMKPFLPDLLERPIPLFWVARGQAPGSTGQDEEETWDVKQVLQDKVFPNGERKFKVRWEGCSSKDDTWELPSQFFPGLCLPFIEYAKRKNLSFDMTHFLGPDVHNPKAQA